VRAEPGLAAVGPSLAVPGVDVVRGGRWWQRRRGRAIRL